MKSKALRAIADAGGLHHDRAGPALREPGVPTQHLRRHLAFLGGAPGHHRRNPRDEREQDREHALIVAGQRSCDALTADRIKIFHYFKYTVYALLMINVYVFFAEEWAAVAHRFSAGLAPGDVIEAFARDFANSRVARYHELLETFPSILVARPFGFERRRLFAVDSADARRAATVDLDPGARP